MPTINAFWRRHLVIPLSVFIAVVSIFEWRQWDIPIADALYAWQGGQWYWRDHVITSTLLHEGGKYLVLLGALALLLTLITSRWIPALQPWRKGLLYLLVSMATSTLLVSIIKAISHVDCPWDLLRYGGSAPYIPIFAAHPGTFGDGRCFPSGHASGAYAWMALYYVLLIYRPRLRFAGLAVGIVAGLIFGIAQQLRGAHFVSHDIWTAGLAWWICTCWFYVFFRREFPTRPVVVMRR